MSFERSDILIPILDDLAANDQALFSRSIAPPILTRLASQGKGVSTAAAKLVYQGFRDALTKRAADILSKMTQVLKTAYIEDFGGLAEGLKAELLKRLESTLQLQIQNNSDRQSLYARIPSIPICLQKPRYRSTSRD
jgi:hypothetical protein